MDEELPEIATYGGEGVRFVVSRREGVEILLQYLREWSRSDVSLLSEIKPEMAVGAES